MAGPIEGGGPENTNDLKGTPPPLTKEQIEGRVFALKSLIKSHNRKNKGDPIRLNFKTEDTEMQDYNIAKGKEVVDEDLGKPFKEARRTPLTRRIIEFAGPEYKMPTNIKLYDGTADPEDHLSRFASAANSGEWPMHSFMDSVKSPELAKRFSDKVPTTVNEMMERLDDFVRSEAAYANTELLKGETGETHRKMSLLFNDTRHPGEKGEVAITEEVLVNPSYSDQLVTIGGGQFGACKEKLKCLLKDNINVFAWEPSDMTGVPRRIIEHALNVNPSLDPVCQKRRTFSMEKSGVVTKEVAEWVKAGIVRPVKYPTYISNPVLVKKRDGTWRMCIDFKNLNSACPKDYYPLPNIDYQGTYCYTKMPFGLKNAGATYQRLVDSTFQSQIGRNLEAYVDDMVIKSKDEKILLADIAETFDNLKKINMKLNPKKCSFGVEEGKFLGYMVTSEGIRANPRKTKALMDLQSSRTLKEMQSLSGKLAALNRFLAKSAESSRKETLYAYLAVSTEAVSAVLLTDRKGRQCPVQYVSRTLNEAERNYAPIEKLALSLIHMTRRLRRYFEAHPVKVITDQPIKKILSNTETSGKLAKYVVELGSYNITFIPRNAVKGQVLSDFLLEFPKGEKEESYFRTPKAFPEKDDTETWTLFTNGASSPKGSGAGLVLIGPSGIEYTYALRPTFLSTNNKAEYEALLAGLRIAREMNISNIEVKVDSKLVASQINGSYEASKDNMIKYLAKANEYSSGFKSFSIKNIPRNMNQKADVLSNLASVAFNHLTKEVNYVIRDIHMGSCGSCSETTENPHDVLAPGHSTSEEWTFLDHYLRFGLPLIIVTDNGAELVNDPFKSWCGRFEIHQMNTAVAHPQANGLVERANRSLMEGIKTRLGRENAGWVDELPNVFEAVIPAEIGIPTYRTLIIREEYNEEEMHLNLDLLQEMRETAAIREARYKTKMEHYYSKKVVEK
ncbi:reverse transcriptase domain-containing protein [Tanacetum coccineum]